MTFAVQVIYSKGFFFECKFSDFIYVRFLIVGVTGMNEEFKYKTRSVLKAAL